MASGGRGHVCAGGQRTAGTRYGHSGFLDRRGPALPARASPSLVNRLGRPVASRTCPGLGLCTQAGSSDPAWPPPAHSGVGAQDHVWTGLQAQDRAASTGLGQQLASADLGAGEGIVDGERCARLLAVTLSIRLLILFQQSSVFSLLLKMPSFLCPGEAAAGDWASSGHSSPCRSPSHWHWG